MVSHQGTHWCPFFSYVFTKKVTIRATAYNPASHTATINLAKRHKGPVKVTVDAGLPSADGMPISVDVTDMVA